MGKALNKLISRTDKMDLKDGKPIHNIKTVIKEYKNARKSVKEQKRSNGV